MKPEWQAVLDEIATRDPVITDEPYGLMDVVAYSAELRTRIAELEAGLRDAWANMAERRGYAKDWEYKYGEQWDEEDAAIEALLNGRVE